MRKIPVNPLAVGPDDAARMLGTCRSRVYQLMKSGELPSYKDGRLRRILVADIEARIARFMLAPAPTGPLLSREGLPIRRKTKAAPLLPVEQQRIAIERATEPQPAGESPALADPQRLADELQQAAIEPPGWVRE